MVEQHHIRMVVGSPDRSAVEDIADVWASTHDLELVAWAPTVPALCSVLADTAWDVVVDAPAFGGVALLQELITHYSRGVVLCTPLLAYDAALLAVGTHGYVTTDDTLADLLAVLRTVAQRGWARSPLAESCWQWYQENADTMAPVQAQALLRRLGVESGPGPAPSA